MLNIFVLMATPPEKYDFLKNETGTFGGFRKRVQSLSYIRRIFNIGSYGTPPLKNQNFAWENANKHTDTQTHKIHVLQV